MPAAGGLAGGVVDEHSSLLQLYQRRRQRLYRLSVLEVLLARAYFEDFCERVFGLAFEFLEFFRRNPVPWPSYSCPPQNVGPSQGLSRTRHRCMFPGPLLLLLTSPPLGSFSSSLALAGWPPLQSLSAPSVPVTTATFSSVGTFRSGSNPWPRCAQAAGVHPSGAPVSRLAHLSVWPLLLPLVLVVRHSILFDPQLACSSVALRPTEDKSAFPWLLSLVCELARLV